MFLLENNLILQNTPRCASHTTEHAIVMSDLEYKYIIPVKQRFLENERIDLSKIGESNRENKEEFFDNLKKSSGFTKHLHIRMNEMYTHFGMHESAGITRDYFDKFLSSLRYFYHIAGEANVLLSRSPEDVDNKFIMDVFDTEFFNISEHRMDETSYLMERLVQKSEIGFVDRFNFPIVFNSINWWNSGNKLTYEFDISKLDQFKEFIENRFNKEIILESKNVHPHIKFPNLIINDELKGHIWQTIEKKYHVKKLF
jgi:hypothetical protein